MAIRRRTLMADPNFLERLTRMQGKIKAKNGREPSLTELSGEIIKVPAFNDVEDQVIKDLNKAILKIKFDRKLQ